MMETEKTNLLEARGGAMRGKDLAKWAVGVLATVLFAALVGSVGGVLEIVSVATNGTQGDNDVRNTPSVSATGRFVAFESTANSLLPASNGIDVYLRDTCMGAPVGCTPATTRISVASDGVTDGDNQSSEPRITPDGRFVAFRSSADNIVLGNTTLGFDSYVRDTCFGAPAGCVPATIQVSVANNGTQFVTQCRPAISTDGRFVAFCSNLNPPVAGLSPGIIMRDTCVGAPAGCVPSTFMVSLDNAGTPGNASGVGDNSMVSMSPDARFVTFVSASTNLVTGDTNNSHDVFLRDTCIGAVGCTPSTIRVSVANDGSQSSFGCDDDDPAVSDDGRFVAFSCGANLLPGDTNPNGFVRIFLRDTCIGASGCVPSTTRVSVLPNGSFGSGDHHDLSASSTGRFVAFSSTSNSLITGDGNSGEDIFVRDTCAGAAPGCMPSTGLVSVRSDGVAANGDSSHTAITPNGLLVAFASTANNLVANDTNGFEDFFLGSVFSVTGTGADLSIAQTDAPDPVTLGQGNVTYTVTVSNAGPASATAVTLTDTMPASATFVTATASQGSCPAPAAGVLTCNLGTINNGANATISIVVTPTAAGTMNNSVSVTAAESDPTLPNTATAATTVSAVQADLVVTNTDSPDPVNVGSNVTYQILVFNAGPSAATAVNLTDTLPAGLTFVSGVPTTGTCTGTTTVNCNLGTINSGSSATVAIVALATASAAASVSNTATATSTVADPNAANNSATATTAVTTSANISVTITSAPNPVAQGSNITYTVVVSNAGPSSAANVTATMAVPANTTFVSATATAGTCTLAAGTITCTIGTLANGASVTATVIVTATGIGTVSAIVNVASTTSDPTPGNNSATPSTSTTVNAAGTATDFGLTVTPMSQSVVAGLGTNFTATATPTPAGATFPNAVTFTCLPAQTQGVGASCTNPTVTVASGGTTATATFQVVAVPSAYVIPMNDGPRQTPWRQIPWPMTILWVLSLSLVAAGFAGRRLTTATAPRQHQWGYCYSLGLALLALSTVMTQAACGNGAAPRGPVNVTITATSGSISRTSTVTVTLQ